MQCPLCQHENPAAQNFCGECGARLVSGCPSCSASNPPGQKFCGECGTALGSPAEGAKYRTPRSYTPKHLAEKILTSKAALEGERKHVTVLFADLKGSMELLADRDPEEARKLLDPVLGLEIQAGVAASKTTGTLLLLAPLYMLAFADALLKSGRAVEGLGVVDETLASMAPNGVGVFHSEFHRLRGELFLARAPSDHAEAEACFRRAVDVARHQGAHGWELRAATSLGRLVGRRGNRDEARQRLADVYARFTEGFDTADLREAKAMLEELS